MKVLLFFVPLMGIFGMMWLSWPYVKKAYRSLINRRNRDERLFEADLNRERLLTERKIQEDLQAQLELERELNNTSY